MTLTQFRNLPFETRQEVAQRVPAGKMRQAYNLMFGYTTGCYCRDNTWKKVAALCGIPRQELLDCLMPIIVGYEP